jgi:hydrogenase maturation protein HypF
VYARRRANEEGLELLPVQHHHAHMASCMAENHLEGPVIGVTFDGTGFGTDGTIWGGEFLVGDCHQFSRAAHLRYVAMPGADKAIREPWRMGFSCLIDAGLDESLLKSRIEMQSLRTVRQMVEKKFNAPVTSSAGRLFDAVAALAGIRDRVSYEGQAAVEMESLAGEASSDGAYPFEISDDASMVVDTRPIVFGVAADVSAGISSSIIARRFHSTMVSLIVAVCGKIRIAKSISSVVLSGGVFLNALLTTETMKHLEADGFSVFRHRLVPPNDGGLSLGQLAVAAAKYRQPNPSLNLTQSRFVPENSMSSC